MFKTNIDIFEIYKEAIFPPSFSYNKLRGSDRTAQLAQDPTDRKETVEQIFENRSIQLHTPYSFRDAKYRFCKHTLLELDNLFQ